MKRATLALLAVAAVSSAQQPIDSAEIVTKVSPAVVLIKGESTAGTVLGSGLIVSKDGKIATNLHVIRVEECGGTTRQR